METAGLAMEGVVICRKYRVTSLIGRGSFGEVYVGTDLETNEFVAIKMESLDAKNPQLYYEYRVYRSIYGVAGIPNVRWIGTESGHKILVMDLLGPSLGLLFESCRYKFSLKTVLMLADQMIQRIQYLHRKGFLHRDLKPDNFLMGMDQNIHVVHIIDFGLAKRFRYPRSFLHTPHKETKGERKGLTGTALYTSINNHNGIEQSRRDDMESLGYLLLYFLRGTLPWQGERQGATETEQYEMIRSEKMATSIESLCESYPKEFASYFHYCRSLGFEDTPDYAYLRKLFRDLFLREGFQYDNMFDWTILMLKEKEASAAVPRLPGEHAQSAATDMVPGVKNGRDAPEPV